MNKKCWHIAGIIFTVIFGSILHFTYDWSGENPIVGLFSAVNESTWEHLKLLAIPILLFSVIEYFAYGKSYLNFIPVKVISVLIGMLTIVTVFYTYVGIIGQHYLWADITTFILGAIASYLFSYHFLETDYFASNTARQIGCIGLFILLLSFIAFTFNPPHIGLFLDPVTKTYGIRT